jgi:pheromone shutdown protein TraB
LRENRTEVYLIGTAHVIDLREEVKSLICAMKPSAVGVELDSERLSKLLKNEKIGGMQGAIAKLFGTTAGNDMIGAVEGAREVGADVFEIDKNLQEVIPKIDSVEEGYGEGLKRILKNFREFGKFFFQSGISTFKCFVQLDIKNLRDRLSTAILVTTEQNVEGYRKIIRMISPDVSQIIMEEREENMMERIKEIIQTHNKVVVVTGMAHVPALVERLNKFGIKVENLTGNLLKP